MEGQRWPRIFRSRSGLRAAELVWFIGRIWDIRRARNATLRANLWPQLFQVMAWCFHGSREESLLSQSVRLTPPGQIEGRLQRWDGGGSRSTWEKEALYLYERSLAEGADWYNSARRPLVVSRLSRRSTPERNELMQDWSEID